MSHARLEPTLAVVIALAAASPLTVLPAAGADAVSDGTAPATPTTTQDGEMTVLRGNASLFGAVEGPADLRRARREGRLRASSRLVAGDLLVLRIRSGAFVDAIAAREGATATDRFFALLARPGYGLAVAERTVSPSQRPSELSLDRNTTRVVTDRANDTTWVLVDTRRTATVLRDGAGDNQRVVERSLSAYEFTAGVTLPEDGGDGGTRALAATGAFVSRRLGVTATGGGLRLVDDQGTVSPDATVVRLRGTTTLLPGTRLRLRAVRPNGSVLASATVRTEPLANRSAGRTASRFGTTLDLSGLAPDDRATLVVTDGERTVRRWTLFAGRAPRIETASARLVESGDREGQIALTVRLRLPERGVVVAGSGAAARVPEGRSVARTLYLDRSVADESGEIAVAVLWDVDRDGVPSGPDRGFEGPDGTTLDRVLPVEGLATDATTTTATTARPTLTLVEREGSPTPGFGVTTVALAAAFGALALLWHRRSNR